MECYILPTARLRPSERQLLATKLTRPYSDFQRSLTANTAQGTIALCLDQGEIIGWARTEMWQNWNTLEAFVDSTYRGRGVATFAAAGLVASCQFFRGSYGYATGAGSCAAVFHPSMKPLSRKVGVYPVLYERHPDGTWNLA